MAFWNQLRILLWKNYTLRKRQKYRLLAEIVAPMVLFAILALVRTRPDLKSYHSECHFDGKAMPSAGLIPLLQSFMCTFNNTCHERATVDELTGSIGTYNQSMITHLLEDIEGVLNDHIDRQLISDLLEDWEILRIMINKINEGTTQGGVRIGTLLSNPQNVSDEIQRKNIGLSMNTLIQLMNASIDFSQLNKPNMNKLLEDFDVCPEDMSPGPLAMEIWNRTCSSGSILYSLKFTNHGQKNQVKDELCALDMNELDHLYQSIKDQYDVRRFFMQMFKFVFMNTQRVPNVAKTYEKLKQLLKDFQSLTPTNLQHIKKLVDDISSQTLNSSSVMKNIGKVVCGSHRFLQIDISKSQNIIERVEASNRPDRKILPSSASGFGEDVPHCKNLVEILNAEVSTQLLWKILKPVVVGKILYAPNTKSVRKIIGKANQTYSDIGMILQLAKDWDKYANDLKEYLSTDSMFDLARQFSKSCLCNMVENMTKPVLGDMGNTGVCQFLIKFLDNKSNGDTMNWIDVLEESKKIAKAVYRYGKCFVYDKFVGYETEAELEEASASLIESNSLLGAVVFDIDKTKNAYQLPTHIKYKIRMSADRVEATDKIIDHPWKPGPRRIPGKDTKFLTYGFAHMQDMIDHAIIKLQTGKETNIGVVVQQFPYPCYIEDAFVYAIEKSLPLFLVLSWLFSVAMISKNIVYEKEKRLREVMKIMGLGNGVHWVAWFINAFVVMFFVIGLMTVLLKYGGVLGNTDPTVILVFFTSFAIATIMQCFFISVFFSRANLAACCTGFLYLSFYIPYLLAKRKEEVMTFSQKMSVSLSSSIAFGFGCSYLARFEQEASGIHWDNIWDSTFVDDKFSLMHCIMMMMVDAFIYGLMTWYIEAVYPGQYGVPRPWYFPVQKSYWCGQGVTTDITGSEHVSVEVDKTGKHIDEEPKNRPLGVQICNLTKVYNTGKKVAVDGLSLNFYEGQITSFLGHNGAGKTTTMSVLTGLFPPTEGTAYIYGKDIRTDINDIRSSLGMCPQHDVLFQFLTVEEHIWFYSQLKGLSIKESNEETKKMIQDISLSHRQHEFPRMLSGGMKRKLSVAIAFVGHVKTVILDEPTAGVDPYARRSIWELLLKFKEGRTIILSTHHMDEADVLGDRIAIISNGKLCCLGTSLFLKSTFGNGYYLTLVRNKTCNHEEEKKKDKECLSQPTSPHFNKKSPVPTPRKTLNQRTFCSGERKEELSDGSENMDYTANVPESSEIKYVNASEEKMSSENEIKQPSEITSHEGATEVQEVTKKQLLSFVRMYVRKASLVEDVDTELTYQLPEEGAHNGDYEDLFMELERSHKKMGISSFGISDTSLEEVFLKVTEEGEKQSDEYKRKKLEENTDGGRVPRPVTNLSFKHNRKASFLRSTSVDEKFDVTESTGGFSHELQEHVGEKLLILMQAYALLIKRFHHFRRSKKGLFCEIVMPVVFILFAVAFAKIGKGLKEPKPVDIHPWHYTPKLEDDGHLYMFYSNDETGSELGHRLVNTLLKSHGIGNRCLNPDVYKMDGYPCHSENVKQRWVMSKSVNTSGECSCSTGVQKCLVGAEGPEPPYRLHPSSDYLYNLTGRSVSDWLLKTNDRYKKIRYGGLSFGEKSPLSDFNNKDIQELFEKFTSADSVGDEFSTKSKAFWRDVFYLFNRISAPDISKVWYNNKGYISVVAYLNIMNNVILRSSLPRGKDPANYGISVVNHPFSLSKKQSEQESKLNSKTELLMSTCVIFAISFVPASFVMILIEERITNSKHLQFVSGVNPAIYWVTNFFWDLLNYSIPCFLSMFVFMIFGIDAYISAINLPGFLMLLFLFGYAMIPLMYPFSRLFNVPSTAMVTLKSVNIFLGMTSTMTTFILDFLAMEDQSLAEINELLKNIMLILPQYCLGLGLLELSKNQLFINAFIKFELKGNSSPFKWKIIGRNLLSLLIQGTIYFILNILIEYNFFCKRKKLNTKDYPFEDDDPDVSKERRRVLTGGSINDVIKIQNLTKIYTMANGKDKHTAVDRLCVGIPRGQCFGLLGVNGAGKTSTFKMLTGDLPSSGGNAYIDGYSVYDDKGKVRKIIGYCPQFDAYDPLLTAREVLIFYARLRGIPEKDVKKIADWAISKLGLIPYADKLSGSYSGGNKRKLSTGISLIGNPKVIFLDEPTTGMDPKARRFLWNCINSIVKDGRSVILTSHSMEECEALCGRIAIMVNGRFRCIGSIQHLKNRFGDGYTVIIRLSGEQPDFEPVEKFIRTTFPDVVLKEKHHNMLHFQLGSNIKLSYVFGQIESVRNEFHIEDYSISQTTLDQVFINFAKMQTDLNNDSDDGPASEAEFSDEAESPVPNRVFQDPPRISQTGSTIKMIDSSKPKVDPVYVNESFVMETEGMDI